MKLIGSRIENQIRSKLIRSNQGLLDGPANRGVGDVILDRSSLSVYEKRLSKSRRLKLAVALNLQMDEH